MNVIQIARRARQGVDAILPGGYGASQWTTEELIDLTNEAYEWMQREFRLVHRKYGLTTINTSTPAYTRDGETYTPSTALVMSSTTPKLSLPPDFAELVRITCTNNRSIRFFPASLESDHWIDREQGSFTDSMNSLPSVDGQGLVFYYDIIDSRTLYLMPPFGSGNLNLEIDYIPMKRPLFYSIDGTVTVTNGLATIAGVGTRWSLDSVFTEAEGQAAELIIGISDPESEQIRVDRDYPKVTSITSDTAATLKSLYAAPTATDSPFIMAMAPTLPREYHRWHSRLVSALMLSKVNPDVADKFYSRYQMQFKEQINPAIRRRQSQSSPVVEDAEEFSQGAW